MDLEKLKREQQELAKKVVLKDSFEDISLLAGVDQSYYNNKIISAIVVCDKNFSIVEEQHVVMNVKFPYIPGFLSYREAPAIIEAYRRVRQRPDVLMVDGNGILHPLKFGLACHIGLILDIPTIGIAKNLLLGERDAEGKIKVNGDIRGFAILTKQFANPIYVSPGHKISLQTSIKIVKECMKYPHKLPEPLFIAHRKADELREEFIRGPEE